MRYRRAHWHNLANTTELFVCGSDAALGQITLTTCWRFYPTSFTVCMDLSAHRVSGTPRKLSVLVCRDPTLYSKSRSKFSRKSSHLVCWSTSSGNDGSVTRMSGQSFRLPCGPTDMSSTPSGVDYSQQSLHGRVVMLGLRQKPIGVCIHALLTILFCCRTPPLAAWEHSTSRRQSLPPHPGEATEWAGRSETASFVHKPPDCVRPR